MIASPILCSHGVIIGWDVRDALPDDLLPPVDGCPDCDALVAERESGPA